MINYDWCCPLRPTLKCIGDLPGRSKCRRHKVPLASHPSSIEIIASNQEKVDVYPPIIASWAAVLIRGWCRVPHVHNSGYITLWIGPFPKQATCGWSYIPYDLDYFVRSPVVPPLDTALFRMGAEKQSWGIVYALRAKARKHITTLSIAVGQTVFLS